MMIFEKEKGAWEIESWYMDGLVKRILGMN